MVGIWLGNQKHFKILPFALPGNFRKSNLESLKRTISKFDLLGIYKPPTEHNESKHEFLLGVVVPICTTASGGGAGG